MRTPKIIALTLFLFFWTYSPLMAQVVYVPTKQIVVDAMLELAEVSESDVVYDLGCGDGRIVITAAKRYGARGKGVDFDPERIKESKENAIKAGVSDKVEFVVQDMFETDVSQATVVMLFLLDSLNLQLLPKLLEQMEPGSRIVSHVFTMGDWEPEKMEFIEGAPIFLWTVPEKAGY